MDNLLHSGKVRNVYEMGEDYLLMKATDRVSSFDKHIGIISGKGNLLNLMSQYWFNNTKHIIDNHLVDTQDNVSLVHKCRPFMIEVVVRGYITGNTSTSLWTHYNRGSRVYCGIIFPDGLKKHQKLDKAVVTPTTKGIVDKPITADDIVKEGYMTFSEWNYISEKALELFSFGQKIADEANLILVDTKYEFGKDKNGKILLIDELHTCDSSRYWIKSSYEDRINNELDPEKLDKDCIRDWIKSVCDPYKEEIPEIPEYIVWKAYNAYKQFYDSISSVKISNLPVNNNNLVIIMSGSEKDSGHVEKIETALTHEFIGYRSYISSAHKNTQDVLDLIKKYDDYNRLNRRIVWITVAGRSNALSGVVAANSRFPVIACPPFANQMDMLVNINSTIQCPSKVPVMTILEPSNVALAIRKIFDLHN